MFDTLLNTRDAADYLGLSCKTLQRFRGVGQGPVFVKVGPGPRARVRYRKVDLDAWIDANRFTSTSAHAGREFVR